jgi:hypothetical protein
VLHEARHLLNGANDLPNRANGSLNEARDVPDGASDVLDGADDVLDEAGDLLNGASDVLDEADDVLDGANERRYLRAEYRFCTRELRFLYDRVCNRGSSVPTSLAWVSGMRILSNGQRFWNPNRGSHGGRQYGGDPQCRWEGSLRRLRGD